ncbi:restriction endonuclease subunit S (plasmid) [Rhodococcus qingshengii]|uniref:restriction endonuclease subunit S n=1 Tax=Rhodococcus qingshengii TaxID=334542 RepID=UPI001E414FDA|nr:restriction endonuclease subunit S [Rhodococcus qingshengii]UGQ55343.1 restriction endonuclease subunit S [Rhodococcus qingshengii]
MNTQTFLDSFGHIDDASGGVDLLRKLILDLAVRGRLTKQDPDDQPASELVMQISSERDAWVTDGVIRRPKKLSPLDESNLRIPPQGWLWLRLGDVLTFEYGKNLPAGKRGVGDIPVYGANGIVGMHTEALVQEPSLIVGRKGSAGAVNQAPGPSWPTDVTYFVRPPAEIPLRFVEILLRSLNLPRMARGIKPGLDRSEAYACPILLPPLREQHRIVEGVDELMGLCDELEEQHTTRAEARLPLTTSTLHRLAGSDSADGLRAAVAAFANNIGLHLAPGDGDLAVLKRVRQAILDLAVRGRLTYRDSGDEPSAELLKRIAVERDQLLKAKEIRKPRSPALIDAGEQEVDIPETWEWSALGQLVLSSGAGWSPACLPSRRSDESQWAVLKVSAVSWGTFRSNEHKLLTPGLTPRPQIEVQDGDFIMSRANTAELVGRSVIATGPPPRLMLSDKHVRLRFFDRTTAEFVNLVNGSSRARKYYASVATGTSDSMRNITRDQILSLPIPVPSLEEQRRIVDAVAQLHSQCDKLEQQLLAAEIFRKNLGASVVAHVIPADEGSSAV